MSTLLQKVIPQTFTRERKQVSILNKFMNWCKEQEEYRFGWLAASIAGHGCIITIFTALIIISTGNHFVFWPFFIGAMSISLISNLAALPTKITIPVFFLSVLIDISIIVACIAWQ